MLSALPKVSEFMSQALDDLQFTMPPQVEAGLAIARSLGLPIKLPDLSGLQAEAREKVLTSVTELEGKVTEVTQDILSRIEWLL